MFGGDHRAAEDCFRPAELRGCASGGLTTPDLGSAVKPVFNALGNPSAANLRPGDGLDPARRVLVGIYDDDLRRPRGRISVSVSLQPALDLVVKAAPENELSVQVGRWQRISEENKPPGGAQNFRGASPELPEHRTVEVLEKGRRHDQRRVLSSCLRLDPPRMQKRLDALLSFLVMEDLDPAFLDNRPDLRRLIPVQRTVRFQQHWT